MKPADRYLKFVKWSEEDSLYVGFCPDLFPWGGVCHSADEVEAYRILNSLVEEDVEDALREKRELPEPSTRPMCEPAGV